MRNKVIFNHYISKGEVKKKMKIECTVEEFKKLIEKEPRGNGALKVRTTMNLLTCSRLIQQYMQEQNRSKQTKTGVW